MRSDEQSVGPDASPEMIDDAFLALRDRNRRYVCYFLLEYETASLSEVADVVSGWINATNGSVVEPRCRTQCYLDLRHVHVPTLVDVGVISYDETTGTLSLAPCPDPVRELAMRACSAETGP